MEYFDVAALFSLPLMSMPSAARSASAVAGLGGALSAAGAPAAFGGGASAAWHLFSPALFRELERASYVYRLTMPDNPLQFVPGKTNVMPALLGTDSGLLGAAMVPRYAR